MTSVAKGTFDVKLVPLTVEFKELAETLGRMSIDKKFSGDLEGTSKGEMLSTMGIVKGSAGYVAIEKVTGILNGKSGTFVLQHSGTMNRSEPSLTVTVIPDSGTGDLTGLAGLAGKLLIKIENKQHFYELEYTLPAK
jgi:hypothetical protein